jgi:hypothetical protein
VFANFTTYARADKIMLKFVLRIGRRYSVILSDHFIDYTWIVQKSVIPWILMFFSTVTSLDLLTLYYATHLYCFNSNY